MIMRMINVFKTPCNMFSKQQDTNPSFSPLQFCTYQKNSPPAKASGEHIKIIPSKIVIRLCR